MSLVRFLSHILIYLSFSGFQHFLTNMATGYDPPSWAGKPSVGLHLDVLKETKLIQKLMIDEKKCYLFGRNPQMNDFCIDHGSCSRVHAALVWHKHLERSFLVDLGSSKFVHTNGKITAVTNIYIFQLTGRLLEILD